MTALMLRRRAMGKPAFSPKDIAGLRLWLPADQISGLVDADPVTTWPDKSADANNVAQATAAAKPTYRTAILNGKPVVRFDGVDDNLLSGSNSPLTGDVVTTFFLVVNRTTPTGKCAFAWGSAATVRNAIGYFDGFRGANAPSIEFAGNTPATFAAGLTAGYHIVTVKKTAGAINTTTSLWIDGASQAIQAGSSAGVPAVAAAPFAVGRFASDADEFWSGDVAEVAVYDSALSDADRRKVESHLGTKYAIAVT